MNQIRLSELLPGKALKWPEFFVRNIPNIRLESRVIPESQCFRYLHKKGILKVFTTVNQRVLGSSRGDIGIAKKIIAHEPNAVFKIYDIRKMEYIPYDHKGIKR
jgi:hypothetical protein